MIYDLIVIGGGSGGVRAARIAASLGAKVAICEDTHWGGTCVNVGCVPKKLYHYAAALHNQIKLGQAYGWQLDNHGINWQAFYANKEKEIKRLTGIYQTLLTHAGCDVYNGFARLLPPQTNQPKQSELKLVQVQSTANGKTTTQQLQGKNILLATGGQPDLPPITGIEYAISSDDMFALDSLPERLLVVGGGYIACEMASIFHHLGVAVTLAVRSKLLRPFDRESVAKLTQELDQIGLTIHMGISPTALAKNDTDTKHIQVTFNDGSKATYNQVLFATGRSPRLAGLGLEHTTIKLDKKGFVEVDNNFATAEKGIYAIGDIINGLELTPVALAQGMYLARQLFAETKPLYPALNTVATAIFTHPQLATVGLTEEQASQYAKNNHCQVAVYTSHFRHIKYSVTDFQKKTFIKLLVDINTDKLLGLHLVGDEVGEIMQGFSVLFHTGITKTQLDQTIGIHPTVAEEIVTMREPTRIIG